MRDRYKSEVERAQAELKQNLSGGGGSESEALARSQEQVPSYACKPKRIPIYGK